MVPMSFFLLLFDYLKCMAFGYFCRLFPWTRAIGILLPPGYNFELICGDHLFMKILDTIG